MLDENKADKLLERFYNRFNKYNSQVLEEFGKIFKQFDGLTPTEAHKLAQELKYNATLDNLANELSKITEKSLQDIYDMFDKVAENNLEFAKVYYEAKEVDFIPYNEREELQRYIKALAGDTSDFLNIINTRTIGFTQYDPYTKKYVFKDLPTTYIDLIDEAVYATSTGKENYQSAIRKTIKQLANSGIKVNEYKLGFGDYNIRLDSAVRRHILDGLRDVNQGIQDQIGSEIGSDGVELSAHNLCAEDHLPYQGKQFTNEEFEELQLNLARPIGEYNCKHFVNRIILGVDQPSYPKNILKEYKNNSNDKIEFEGNTYTRYEATQVQRKIETQIRKWKDQQIIARASGNNDTILQAQNKITQLTTKYKEFSDAAGLDTYMQRLRVSGYRRVAIK